MAKNRRNNSERTIVVLIHVGNPSYVAKTNLTGNLTNIPFGGDTRNYLVVVKK
jgi:hypothetical protein